MVVMVAAILTSKDGITMKKYKYKKKIKVNCQTCRKWVDEELTTFVNIEEDIQGADVLTFICPYCRQEQKSKRFA
jgi:hypothetical protein